MDIDFLFRQFHRAPERVAGDFDLSYAGDW